MEKQNPPPYRTQDCPPGGYQDQPGADPTSQGYPQQPGYQPVAKDYQQPVQPDTVIVCQPGTVTTTQRQQFLPPATFTIFLSCFVVLFCCCPLGVAAFIVVIRAMSAPEYSLAVGQLRLSKKLSIAGIVVGVIGYTVLFIFTMLNAASSNPGY